MTNKHWKIETDDSGVAWVCFDKADSGVNVLSAEVMIELETTLQQYAQNPPRGLVIYSGKRSGFIMGADITEFSAVTTPELAYEVTRRGQKLFDKIEKLGCPTVSVIDGFCLGGGLELAMSTDYRLALPNKKPILGLPEVQLGLHPGFGGTVRVIQICGVRPGMQIMLSGKPITVEKARRIGLVDRIAAEDDWRQAALDLIASGRAKRKRKASSVSSHLFCSLLFNFIAWILPSFINMNHIPRKQRILISAQPCSLQPYRFYP